MVNSIVAELDENIKKQKIERDRFRLQQLKIENEWQDPVRF